MKLFQAKRARVYHGWRRLAYSWPAIIVLALVILYFSRSVWGVYERWNRNRKERNEAQSRYQNLEKRNKELEASVAGLKTERGWEAEVRKNFQVAKPGEELIIILDEEADTKP